MPIMADIKGVFMAHITINQDSIKPRRDFKRHQVQPGQNIYRILPPFGDESVHNNYPYKRWSLAWMIDPVSGRKRPFALPPFERDKVDPVTQYVKLLSDKNAIEKMIESGVDAATAESTVREKLSEANKLVYELRPKAGFFYNACNKAGEIGILELKKTAHDALKAEMYEYIKDYSQDPTSLSSLIDDSGVWFNIERIGEKGDKDTEYKVKKHQLKKKNERGQLIFEDDRGPLPEHVVNNYDKMGYDIYNLYQVKTFEELHHILMFNLKDIVANIPITRIDGFDPAEHDFNAAPVEAPVQVAQEKKPQGSKAVKLAMELNEDPIEETTNLAEGIFDDVTPTPAPKVVAPPVKKPEPVVSKPAIADDDIVALAESFLNS